MKITKSMLLHHKASTQSDEALYQARLHNAPFTSYPLVPWCLTRIKERFAATGALCNQAKCV